MHKQLERFYGELDERYLQGDLAAVERFLLAYEAEARQDPLRRRGELGPYDGELIVLHMVPKGPGRSERYIVGRLEVEAGRTWMEGGGNVLLPAEMRKHYELRWVYLPEDEGKKEARETC